MGCNGHNYKCLVAFLSCEANDTPGLIETLWAWCVSAQGQAVMKGSSPVPPKRMIKDGMYSQQYRLVRVHQHIAINLCLLHD